MRSFLTLFLLSWLPLAAQDAEKTAVKEPGPEMGFTAIPMRNPDIGMIVEVKVGDANLKLFFNPNAKNTILDIEPADRAALKITDSSTTFNDAAGNQTVSKQATNAPFKFGDAEAVEATVLVIDLSLIGAPANQ